MATKSFDVCETLFDVCHSGYMGDIQFSDQVFIPVELSSSMQIFRFEGCLKENIFLRGPKKKKAKRSCFIYGIKK